MLRPMISIAMKPVMIEMMPGNAEVDRAELELADAAEQLGMGDERLAADARQGLGVQAAVVGALELECGVERVETRHSDTWPLRE